MVAGRNVSAGYPEGLAVGLFRPGGRLSANLAYGLKFGEDYRSSDASISVRLRW